MDLRTARLYLGLTLQELFLVTGIQPCRLSHLERGLAEPTEKEITILWNVLVQPRGGMRRTRYSESTQPPNEGASNHG